MKGGKLIKICGMTEAENIRAVEALGVDLMGFIFYPRSPRCARAVPAYLPAECRRVGVFVDAPFGEIQDRVADFGLDFVQLHGNESPQVCRKLKELGIGVIKAFHIETEDDIADVAVYDGLCDYYLFDTKCPEAGGSGRCFDWSLLSAYGGATPFLLSGGLGPGSSDALKSLTHPALAGYDLNSRFEKAPGIKDAESLRAFIETIE